MKNKKKSLKKTKSKFSLRGEYIKSWNYIKESRNFIYFVIAVFFIFVLIGFLVPVPEEFSNMILEYIKEIVQKTEGLTSFGLIKFIFLNNLQSSFTAMVFGFALGIIPFLATIFNGFIVGFVSAMATETNGFVTLLNLLPHGIFELPAIFISLGLGIKLGSFVFQKNKGDSFRKYLWEGLRVFIFIILPLLVIAAIIEGLLI